MPLEPELPQDALLELGRLTWASLNLEDRAYAVCGAVTWYDNTLPIGTRIGAVRRVLAELPPSASADAVDEWLAEAAAALEGRNAILHATPVSWVRLPGTEPIPDVADDWLTFVPRAKSGKPVVHTALTASALIPVRRRVENAIEGWVEIVLRWLEEQPRT